MAYLLKFGGVQVGTELLFDLPAGDRLAKPIEDAPIGFDAALLSETPPAVLWRPRFVVWHESGDMFTFSQWIFAMVRMFRGGRRDVTVWDDSTLKLTYPQCAFASFSRPQPQSPAEAFFCAEVGFDFVTDEDPY